MSRPSKLRILYVGLAESIHSARWTAQLKGWPDAELHFFGVSGAAPHREFDEVKFHTHRKYDLRNMPRGASQSVVYAPWLRGSHRIVDMIERLFPETADRAVQLNRVIRTVQPHIVHSLGVQHGGYLVADANRKSPLDRQFLWLVSTWGSDLIHFGSMPAHQPLICDVLKQCDGIMSDCPRDIGLADRFGFHGRQVGVFPGGGGYEVGKIQSKFVGCSKPSKRRAIMLKGYHDDEGFGRALVGLHALLLCADLVRKYKVLIYSASQQVVGAAEFLSRVTGIEVQILSALSHAEILSEFSQSRLAIGLSVSDGLPNSFLEAMITGAFPIQSNTADLTNWGVAGQNWLTVPCDSAEDVAVTIRRAMTDDQLVDSAAVSNAALTRQQLEAVPISAAVIEAYRKFAFAGGR